MSQAKQILQKSLVTITYLGTAATFYVVNLSLNDIKLKENYLKSQQEEEEQSEGLVKQIHDLKIEGFQNEINKLKFENLKNNLEIYMNKYKEQFESLKNKTDGINTTDVKLNSDLEALNKQGENIVKIVEDINKLLNDQIEKFLGDNNLFELLLNLYNNWMIMLSNLNLHQLIALAHLMSGIFLLYNLFNIIFILFGEFLINYFKLEEKFPRMAIFIKLRKKLQRYYLILIIFLMISILLLMIYTNLTILFYSL
uniref:Uncharacterized protein n=1 Tax=Amanita phalloides TaxID=67723 RepID=A0A5Q0N2A8_AMAPH|nr:hypothetical protein [Amanita phalloides]QFZ98684.1 hypothetical protein [Amanita phalloides]